MTPQGVKYCYLRGSWRFVERMLNNVGLAATMAQAFHHWSVK